MEMFCMQWNTPPQKNNLSQFRHHNEFNAEQNLLLLEWHALYEELRSFSQPNILKTVLCFIEF